MTRATTPADGPADALEQIRTRLADGPADALEQIRTRLADALEQIRTKPTVRVPVACAALDLSDWAGFQAIKRGDFPVPVCRVGRRILVLSRPLRDLLGLEDQ